MFGLRIPAAPAATASAVVPQAVETVLDVVARDFFANYQRWCTQDVELEPAESEPSLDLPIRAHSRRRDGALLRVRDA